jgi:hypothetical protein
MTKPTEQKLPTQTKPSPERKEVLTDGGISAPAKHGIDLVTPEQWATKGYPMPPKWKGNGPSGASKEEWAKTDPKDQRLYWWMLMSGGNMSDMSTEEDLQEFILNGGKHTKGPTGASLNDWLAGQEKEKGDPKSDTIQIPKHIYDRPGFKVKLDKLLKEENSEGLRLPHTFIVGGSVDTINNTLVDRRNSIAEHFPNDPLCDMICTTYSLALHQLLKQTPEPTHRLECLLTVTANNVLIDWRTKQTNLPRGITSVAELERFERAQMAEKMVQV